MKRIKYIITVILCLIIGFAIGYYYPRAYEIKNFYFDNENSIWHYGIERTDDFGNWYYENTFDE